MKIHASQYFSLGRTVRAFVSRRGLPAAGLAAAALLLFSGPSLAQNAAKARPMTGHSTSTPVVIDGVAPNSSTGSPAKTPTKAAAPAAPAVQHAPAVAYLLLDSAQGPLNGGSTDAAHRNWIAVSAIDKGNIADGAAKGQASDAMQPPASGKSGDNPLFESGKDSIARGGSGNGQSAGVVDSKNISDGAAKGQAVDAMARNSQSGGSGKGQNAGVVDTKNSADGAAKGQANEGAMQDKNIADGAAKGQAQDSTAPGFPALDAGAKDAAKMASVKNNPLYESKEDRGSIADGAAKGQANEGVVQDKNISDGAAKGQASDAAYHASSKGGENPLYEGKGAMKMNRPPASTSGSFSIRKEIDRATPMIQMAASSGTHFSTGQLDVLDGGVWHHYQLSDVTVGSQHSSGGGTAPTEEVTFTFQKIILK